MLGKGGDNDAGSDPTQMDMAAHAVTSAAGGFDHCCVVTQDGKLSVFGPGHRPTDGLLMSLEVPSPVKQVSCGEHHTSILTVAALLLGLYTPSKGQALLDGVVLDNNTIPNARKSIGTVLQQPALMSGTIAEQIALGCSPGEATEENIIAAGDAAHASGFINMLPEKYNTELGERGAQLSGGQQQRLSIARAVARRPKLVLLDEPTAALDVDAERAVDEALQEIKGVTKVIIAHRLSTIRSADSIVVIVGGRVVEQGNHFELIAIEGGHYQRMVFNSELGGGSLSANSIDNGAEDVEEKIHAVAVSSSASATTF